MQNKTIMPIKSLRFRWPVLSFLIVSCLIISSCEKTVTESLEVPGDVDNFENDLSENKATSLATFKLSNGNVIEFVGMTTEDGDEMGVSEYGPDDVSVSPFLKSEITIPEMYMKLNVDNHPVPAMIAKAAKLEGEVEIVEKLDKVIEVDVEDLAVEYPNLNKGASSQIISSNGKYCYVGGYALFSSENCSSASFPGNTWWYCSSGAWLSKNHWTSGHKRRKSTAITAACHGGANNHTLLLGNWKMEKKSHLPFATFWKNNVEQMDRK